MKTEFILHESVLKTTKALNNMNSISYKEKHLIDRLLYDMIKRDVNKEYFIEKLEELY